MTRELYLALLVLVVLERLVEVVVSTRNARRLLARGAVEAGRGHFPVMVLMHAAFLVACALEPGRAGWWGWPALGGVVVAQALRWWAVVSLGERWNVRVIVLPGDAPRVGGPYRWVRHPNYVAVVLEVACMPLVHGAWVTALVFSVLNAFLLRVRIHAEEAALGPEWQRAFEGRPRFVPRA